MKRMLVIELDLSEGDAGLLAEEIDGLSFKNYMNQFMLDDARDAIVQALNDLDDE